MKNYLFEARIDFDAETKEEAWEALKQAQSQGDLYPFFYLVTPEKRETYASHNGKCPEACRNSSQ